MDFRDPILAERGNCLLLARLKFCQVRSKFNLNLIFKQSVFGNPVPNTKSEV